MGIYSRQTLVCRPSVCLAQQSSVLGDPVGVELAHNHQVVDRAPNESGGALCALSARKMVDRAPRRAVDSALSAAERRRAKEKGVTRALQHEVSALQGEVKQLHAVLAQKLYVNSRGIKDVFGKEFALPVDEEHKATKLRIFNFTNPHGRAFHTSCFAGQQKSLLRHVCSTARVARLHSRLPAV